MTPPRRTRWRTHAVATVYVAYFLSVLSFLAGLWLAWRTFPGEFDWRCRTISTLQSPKHNPQGYGWSALGIGVSGLLLWPVAAHLAASLARFSPAGARLVGRSLGSGCLAMILIALFTHRPALFPRLHEYLAFIAYVALTLGVGTTLLLFIRYPAATALEGRRFRNAALFLLLLAGLAPLAAAALLQLYHYLFAFDAPALLQASPCKTQRLPYQGLPFWQWIVTIQLYALLGLLAGLARPPSGN